MQNNIRMCQFPSDAHNVDKD